MLAQPVLKYSFLINLGFTPWKVATHKKARLVAGCNGSRFCHSSGIVSMKNVLGWIPVSKKFSIYP